MLENIPSGMYEVSGRKPVSFFERCQCIDRRFFVAGKRSPSLSEHQKQQGLRSGQIDVNLNLFLLSQTYNKQDIIARERRSESDSGV